MNKARANEIALKALKVRKKFLGIGVHLPVCPYMLCDAIGLDLRFVKIPSFEGMYFANQKLVLISSDRPEGRKRFSCAHEIAHHILEHGTIIDEIISQGSNKQEEGGGGFFCKLATNASIGSATSFESIRH